ncbi:MAG TPA: LON peptidase substrate-binding domain-containing protein [Casimicrobiaceae bacterium]|nr:LON peptidase substrate-binding domain-containing protein [Casimicrobiaceae bacterium]
MPAFSQPPTGRQPFSIPLFPLRTVLFPGGVLPLKIFEQRYIEMAKDCLREMRPFGVCLITRGEEVATPEAAPPEITSIGTLATIASWEMPQLGILHVGTEGGLRFQVHKHSVASSGLVVGTVATLAAETPVALPERHAPLAKLLELIAARVGAANFPVEKRYDDASWVGYRLAELLPLPLSIKQSMLEINDAGVRLDVLSQFLAKQGLI